MTVNRKMATKQTNHDLPYYIDLDEQTLVSILDSAGIREKDHQQLFVRLCKYVADKGKAKVNVEDFTMDVLKWSERVNNPRFRHIQNIRRTLINAARSLEEHYFIRIGSESAEIETIYLQESESYQINRILEKRSGDKVIPFPTESDLQYPIPEVHLLVMSAEEFNKETVNRAIEERKIAKIIFKSNGTHILVSMEYLPNLGRIVRDKLRVGLFPGQKTKLLDDVVRELSSILPDRKISQEKLLRVLSNEEEADAVFMINLAKRLQTHLEEEKENKDIKYKVTMHQAARLLEAFKIYEEEAEREKDRKEKRLTDKENLLKAMRSETVLLNKNDLAAARENNEIIGNLKLDGEYSPVEYRLLVDEFLNEYSKPEEGEENPVFLVLPRIVKIKIEDLDHYIHRENIVPFLVQEANRVASEIRDRNIRKWSNLLGEGEKTPPMKFDEFFQKDIANRVKDEYTVLYSLLCEPQLMYQSFHIHPDDKATLNILNRFFLVSEEPAFRAYHQILRLDRRKLLNEAIMQVPFFLRFGFLRFFYNLFMSIFSSKPVKKKKPATAGASESSGSVESNDNEKNDKPATAKDPKEKRKHWRQTLETLHKKVTSYADTGNAMRDLENQWNIKIGPVRTSLTESVNNEIDKRARSIYSMFQKRSDFNAGHIYDELKNLASGYSEQMSTDIPNKSVFKEYIMVRALHTLKNAMRTG